MLTIQKNKTQGFTLIEIILYVTIASGFLLTITFFFFTLLEARVKNNLILEVTNQGNQVMHIMTQQIRNADAVTIPTTGLSDTELTLIDDGVTYVFNVSGGVLQVTEDLDPSISLTNEAVSVSGFNITNYSLAGTPVNIRIQFTISGSSTSDRQEYSYTKDFIGGASLRRN